MPFGGFVAKCLGGLDSVCPEGFEMKPINNLNGCTINYCLLFYF